ncbi:MAG: thermostable hemolysin [Methylophaga sp.]|nr:thermostable hemolysin [Methylophaga sp.]
MEALQIQTGVGVTSLRKERLLLTHMPIRFDADPSVEKVEVDDYVKQRFAEVYNATIDTFEPYILSTSNDKGISATIGFQPAATKKPLFLENYLTSTVEETLAVVLKQDVKREHIVEVGNLSSSDKGGASRILFILSVAILHQADFKWVTFTATNQVQRLLSKLNLTTVSICEADPTELTDRGESWGSYYTDRPQVVVGNLSDAIEQLKCHKVINSILDNYQNTIIAVANQIAL